MAATDGDDDGNPSQNFHRMCEFGFACVQTLFISNAWLERAYLLVLMFTKCGIGKRQFFFTPGNCNQSELRTFEDGMIVHMVTMI